MREKLIQILEGAGNMRQFPGSLANILIEHGVTIQKWIPVTERLPECDNFLVALANGMVGEAFLMDGDFYWQEVAASWEYENPLKSVTHWMPLPEPPKEVE